MNRFVLILCAGFLLPLAVSGQGVPAVKPSCENLEHLSLPSIKVLSATAIPAGAFEPPRGAVDAGQSSSVYKKLPPFCRIAMESTPRADSKIQIEVWMPMVGWNGKFQAVGNGGFGGYISYAGLAAAVGEGYASASTDTGHSGSFTDSAWALGHPEKIVDFGYRAIHVMTVAAKAAIKAFYGENARRSYFGSCSNGGRQALMEVQRFPDDYDGVMAGAPANFWSHLLASGLWDAQALTAAPGGYVPSSKVPAIGAAVNRACDAEDGVRDGVLNNPRECHFDPASLLCNGAESNSCLSAAQVTTLRKLYEGAHDSRGHAIFPGFVPGAEAGDDGWTAWITGSGPGKSLIFIFATGFFSNFVYDDPNWNYKTVRLDDAVRTADAKLARVLNATDPNLAGFEARGAKLILYHGWNDPAISALNTINYYNSVVRELGAKEVNSFVRLYMVPGMQHCGGGPGAVWFGPGAPGHGDAQHDMRVALERWVEKGTAPEAIVATKYTGDDPSKAVEMTRPLCPYPESAKYKGSGNTNDAANFVCGTGN